MAWNWRDPLGLRRGRTTGAHAQPPIGWTVETRPQHLDRFNELKRDLAINVFGESPPESQAWFAIAGLLNNQLAVMQKAGLLDSDGERVLRNAFSLGYLFGIAAWYIDHYEIPRTSAEAQHLILRAQQEALGPLTAENVARFSQLASGSPDFSAGMEAAASDAKNVASAHSPGAFGLAQFVAKAK